MTEKNNYDNNFNEGIVDFLNDVPLPFSMLIKGLWGVGKTKLFESIKKPFEYKGWKVVKVNTRDLSQRKNYKESLVLTILESMIKVLTDDENTFSNILQNFKNMLPDEFSINLPMFNIVYSKKEKKHIDLYKNIKDKIKEITKESKLLLFIDDLDRIKPELAIQTLDLVKVLFLGDEGDNNENKILCITACDSEIIKLGLKTKYGDSADKYYDKYFKKLFQITISPLTVESESIKKLFKEEFEEKFEEKFKEIDHISKILLVIGDGNYRDIKREIKKLKMMFYFFKKNCNKEDFEKLVLKSLYLDLDELEKNSDKNEDENKDENLKKLLEETKKSIKKERKDNMENEKNECFDTILNYMKSISTSSDDSKDFKDNSKYILKYKNKEITFPIGKGPIVRETIIKYSKIPGTNFSELKELFNKINATSSYDLIIKKEELGDEKAKRYFTKIFKIGNDEFMICNQRGIGNIGIFVNFVNNNNDKLKDFKIESV